MFNYLRGQVKDAEHRPSEEHCQGAQPSMADVETELQAADYNFSCDGNTERMFRYTDDLENTLMWAVTAARIAVYPRLLRLMKVNLI